MTFDPASFLSCCVSIDLEVDPKSARLFAFAAVRGDRAVLHKGAALDQALDRLEALCNGAAHLVGHNILRHDLPHLVANRARLAGLGVAPIDTLWLNPLAFPRNPYHHLVKHYQDGRLQVGHVNDPEQDARLALQVLADQIAAFTKLGREAPDALLAYHHLTTRGEASAGFDDLFQFLRGPAPDEAAAHVPPSAACWTVAPANIGNRHAAAEIRERLRRLIGDDAAGVTVSTCHALAMRLMGASFAGDHEGPRDFDGIVMQAVALLRGDGLSKAEAEALRETLIQGYRWLLVDEYQDIGPEEYALIGAVAGRSMEDDLRISLFSVGDDDQNIYAFSGASIDFIRRFEADYAAKPVWLIENYRSTAHIIAAANAVIAPAVQRMKASHDITVNRARAKAAPGGDWAALDPVAQGRVTLLDAGGDAAQAVAALDELLRLSRLDPDWSWRRCAVIARDWRRLEPVRAYAEALGIPIELANETLPSLWRLREMQGFVRALLADRTRLLTIPDLVALLNVQPQSRWTDLIGEGIGTLARELVEKAAPVPDIVQWFGEWARDVRGEQRGLLLMTAHRAKGLEFDHVAILNGGWDRPSRGEDADAPRRLFYVAMTRARSTLTVLTDGPHAFVRPGDAVLSRRVTLDAAALPRARLRYVPPDPKLVDLSFAGRLRPGDPSLAAIAAARPGDPVHLIRDGDRWRIENAQSQTLARLSRAFAPPEGTTFRRGEVAVILYWRREDGDEEYHHLLRREAWEVVLPELVFQGEAEPLRADQNGN